MRLVARGIGVVGGAFRFHEMRQEGRSVPAAGAGAVADEATGALIGAVPGGLGG